MASDPPEIGSDTAERCWLCDRDRGDLCHVHAPHGDDDGEPVAVVVSLPEGPQ